MAVKKMQKLEIASGEDILRLDVSTSSGNGIDEESGTWRPRSTTSGATIEFRHNIWQRIGNRCYLNIVITGATHSNGDPILGAIQVTGLPFAVKENVQQNIEFAQWFTGVKTYERDTPVIVTGNVWRMNFASRSNLLTIHNDGTPITPASPIRINMSYEIEKGQ